MTHQDFSEENKPETCHLCEEKLKPGKAVWLELVEGTNEFYFHGVPDSEPSQGWFPFGSECAKKMRCD